MNHELCGDVIVSVFMMSVDLLGSQISSNSMRKTAYYCAITAATFHSGVMFGVF